MNLKFRKITQIFQSIEINKVLKINHQKIKIKSCKLYAD